MNIRDFELAKSMITRYDCQIAQSFWHWNCKTNLSNTRFNIIFSYQVIAHQRKVRS